VNETRYADFDGHRLAYRVAGQGPAVVFLHLYRRREPLIHLRLLSDRWQVFEISPLGFGRSDRVPGYAGEALPDQIHAVLDEHGVDRFIICGYSAGGAMAACIARASSRIAGLVCGGYALLGTPTAGVIRQMDRRLPPDHPSRTQWAWVTKFDWAQELRSMTFPRLFYWGSEDTSVQMAKRLRRVREQFTEDDIDFVEFPGVGHEVGGDETLVTELVIPTLTSWVEERLGSAW
jgi:pimeloyl-ACP methyl ester carboxylesterase